MNSKKSLLLVFFIPFQWVHSSLTMLSNYSNQIFSAGCFALAEYQIRTQEKPQFSISSIELDEETKKDLKNSPPMANFFYLILSYRELNQKNQDIIWKNSVYKLFNVSELFSFYELFLGKHKNYTRSFNLQSTIFNFNGLSQQNRLQDLFLLHLPKSYCALENSPLFFAGLNLHWIISYGLSYIFNNKLTSENLISDKLTLKELISFKTNPILSQYKTALMQSFAFCSALGILTNPFPNAYHLLPKNIIHYAHQPNFKGKITLLSIDVFQKIGYLFFVRYILFNALAIINDYAAEPIADFCIKKNHEKIKKTLCLFASGIIILFCCDKMLHVLYQNLNIRP